MNNLLQEQAEKTDSFKAHKPELPYTIIKSLNRTVSIQDINESRSAKFNCNKTLIIKPLLKKNKLISVFLTYILLSVRIICMQFIHKYIEFSL